MKALPTMSERELALVQSIMDMSDVILEWEKNLGLLGGDDKIREDMQKTAMGLRKDLLWKGVAEIENPTKPVKSAKKPAKSSKKAHR